MSRNKVSDYFFQDLLGPEAEIFFRGPTDKSYRRLDPDLYQEIKQNLHKAKL